mmetsp:Transcript_52982/g.102244  ORF Transcript_52982/g.102244 Transcript_52982/m.102244 type:complete len:173 (+) Transcript_52982:63-581(+)
MKARALIFILTMAHVCAERPAGRNDVLINAHVAFDGYYKKCPEVEVKNANGQVLRQGRCPAFSKSDSWFWRCALKKDNEIKAEAKRELNGIDLTEVTYTVVSKVMNVVLVSPTTDQLPTSVKKIACLLPGEDEEKSVLGAGEITEENCPSQEGWCAFRIINRATGADGPLLP